MQEQLPDAKASLQGSIYGVFRNNNPIIDEYSIKLNSYSTC